MQNGIDILGKFLLRLFPGGGIILLGWHGRRVIIREHEGKSCLVIGH